jgi:AcrR family transcriptional regulator
LVRAKGRGRRVRQPQILATAVELVREQGLLNIRVTDVAERAGTSPASVIYYFASKDQLFEQAIADAEAAFYARVMPDLAQLESGVDRLAWLIVRSSTSEWVLWVDTWLYARGNGEMRPAARQYHARWCETIADIVRHGQSRIEFAGVDADEVAARLAALTDGLAVHMVLGHPGRTREHYVEMALKAAALELGVDAEALLETAARVPPEQPRGGDRPADVTDEVQTAEEAK